MLHYFCTYEIKKIKFLQLDNLTLILTEVFSTHLLEKGVIAMDIIAEVANSKRSLLFTV